VTHVRAEFTVEPFVDGTPGPHVGAAVEAARVAGLVPDVGPFATSVTGDAAAVSEAVRAVISAAFGAGATRVAIAVERHEGRSQEGHQEE
jgi:uncharacterized protein YqgV (UPF0045/DUF77 family)